MTSGARGRATSRRTILPAAAAGAAAALSLLGLAGCSAVDERAEALQEARDAARHDLDAAMQQAGRPTYGGLGGSGGPSLSVAADISGERDGLAVYAVCRGAEGEATVRIADEPPVTMACGAATGVQLLDDDVRLTGSRLVVQVEDAPAGSAWAADAAAAPAR